MDEIINVIVTSDNREALDAIGTELLEARLIACIQVAGPIESTYWWKGKMQKNQEWMGIMKSRHTLYARVEQAIIRMHHYETPQIEAVVIKDVLPAYRLWVLEETAGPGGKANSP